MNSVVTVNSRKAQAPAAGHFGVATGLTVEPRSYRPSGCPSLEQFEARFRFANDRDDSPRAA